MVVRVYGGSIVWRTMNALSSFFVIGVWLGACALEWSTTSTAVAAARSFPGRPVCLCEMYFSSPSSALSSSSFSSSGGSQLADRRKSSLVKRGLSGVYLGFRTSGWLTA